MALYSSVFVYVDGALLAEAVSVNVSLQASNQQDIFSLQSGWVGTETGPYMLVVEATNVVPATGPEIPFEKMVLDKTFTNLALYEAGNGKQLTSYGYFLAPSRTAGVGQNQSLSFVFHGIPALFE